MFENMKNFISFGIALTSAAIYCFVLGYLNYFKIIDYPSWFNSHVYFFSAALSKADASLLSINLNGSATFVIFILFAVFFGVIQLELAKIELNKNLRNIKSKITTAVVAIALVILSLLIFKDIFILTLLVLIAPIGSLYFGKSLIGHLELKNESTKLIVEKTKIDEILLVITALLFSWILPYTLGKFTAERIDPLKSFPLAWNNSGFGSNDLLVWKEDDRGFWINCEEKIIYGISNDGNLFFSRSIDDLFPSIGCKR